MEILKINLRKPQKSIVKRAEEVLKKGGVVVYPSGTSYGVAVDALNKEAVRKVFLIKGRNFKKPLSVVVFDIKMAKKIAFIDSRFEKLFRKFYRGPLTLVVKKKKILSDILTAGKKNIGIRIPDSNVIESLVKSYGKPLTATSANVSGKGDVYSARKIFNLFKNRKYKPDLILDAGKLRENKPSTVLDLYGKNLKILRKGSIKKKEILSFLYKRIK